MFGDIDSVRGVAIASSLSEDIHFVPTDVTSYNALLALFDKALELYGHVDVAISNAGIIEQPGWFEPSIDLDSVRSPPSTAVLDVNLTGTLYFSRIAAVYLRHKATLKADKSLILVSSVAGFQESPGLFVYQATKHGVIGLMRSLRKYFPGLYSDVDIRVNCVCPWATDTGMVQTFQEAWKNEGLPMNTPEGVASMIVGVSVEEKLNGESIYVEGNRGWKFEESLHRTQPQWLGESPTSNLAKGQAFLDTGSKWSG
jgi:NAD(P)-dependent dehydrogenase (short-subunit alcohol dehydrogenase family)